MIKASDKSSMNALGEKVARLQKLRKSSSASFFSESNNEDDVQSSSDKSSVRQLLNGEQVHSKLKSTVLLLSESLEEQGKLRALLEYTADPSHILASSKYNGTDHEKELKYRAAILGQEKLLAERLNQTIDLRAKYEEEKQKRIQLEKSVEITNQILTEVQLECDTLKEELQAYRRSVSYGGSRSGGIADGLSRSTGSLRGMPPLASRPLQLLPPRPGARAAPSSSSSSRLSTRNNSNRYGIDDEEDEEEEEQELPPLPAEEVGEGEGGPADVTGDAAVKALLARAIASSQSSSSRPAAGASSVSISKPDTAAAPPRPPPPPVRPPAEVPAKTPAKPGSSSSAVRPFTPSKDPQTPPPTAPDAQQQQQQQVHRSVLLDVDLGQGQKDSILIQQDSDPMALSFDFIEKHQLKPDYFEPLLEYIRATQETLESHILGRGGGLLPALEGGSGGMSPDKTAAAAGVVSSPTLNLRGAKINNSINSLDGSPDKTTSNSSSSAVSPNGQSVRSPVLAARGAGAETQPPPAAAGSCSGLSIVVDQQSPHQGSAPESPARQQLEQLSVVPSRANGLLEPRAAAWSTYGRVPTLTAPHPIAVSAGRVCSPYASLSASTSLLSPLREGVMSPLEQQEQEEDGSMQEVDFSASIKSAIKTYQSISRELKAAKRLGTSTAAAAAAGLSSDLSESDEEDKKSYESFSLSSSSSESDEEEDPSDKVQAGKRRGAHHNVVDQLSAALSQKQRNNRGAAGGPPTSAKRGSTHKTAASDQQEQQQHSLMMNRFQGGGSVPAKGSKNRRTSVFGEIVTRSPSHPNRFKLSDDENEEEEEEKKEEQVKRVTENSNKKNKKQQQEEEEAEGAIDWGDDGSPRSSSSKKKLKSRSRDSLDDPDLLEVSDGEYKAPKRKTIHKKMDKFQATSPMMTSPKRGSRRPPAVYTNRFERQETRPSVLRQLGGSRVPQHNMLDEEKKNNNEGEETAVSAVVVGATEGASARGRTTSEQSAGSSGGFVPPALVRSSSSLRFSDEVTSSDVTTSPSGAAAGGGSRPAPLNRQKSTASTTRANRIRTSINDYQAALGSAKNGKEMQEIFNMAVEVFDKASKMNSSGKLHESLPVYQNALKLFRLSKFNGIQHIQEEVTYWENKAKDSSRRGIV